VEQPRYLYTQREDWAKAATAYQRALDIDPQFDLARKNLIVVQQKLNAVSSADRLVHSLGIKAVETPLSHLRGKHHKRNSFRLNCSAIRLYGIRPRRAPAAQRCAELLPFLKRPTAFIGQGIKNVQPT
jgi:hypothetical protein